MKSIVGALHRVRGRAFLAGLTLVLLSGCPGCPPNEGVNPDGGLVDGGSVDGDGGGDDGGRLDGGLRDAGENDAGANDAGRDGGAPDDSGPGDDGGPAIDGGITDAGDLDAGALDAGLTGDGGPLDAGVPFDAGPLGVTCTADSQCAPDICRLVPADAGNALEGRCSAAGPGERARGDGCASVDDCQTGLCLNALCSGPCDDDNACARNQVCGARVVTADGVSAPADVCLRAILDPQPCTSNADCASTDRICRDLEPVDGGGSALFCANPAPGVGEIGAPCSGNFIEELNFCHTGLCDDADVGEGECTAACTDDGDCINGGPGWTCTASGVGGFDGRLCGEACVRESDCGTGRSCTRRQDLVDNRNEFVCDGYRGPSESGTTVANGSACRTGLARVDGSTAETYCTEICVDDDDCPLAMTCEGVFVPFPDGTGTQELLLCARP